MFKFEGLNIAEYISACCFVCNSSHKHPCVDCSGKVKVARYILLSTVSFSEVPRSKRPVHMLAIILKMLDGKLLQVPLAAIGVGE